MFPTLNLFVITYTALQHNRMYRGGLVVTMNAYATQNISGSSLKGMFVFPPWKRPAVSGLDRCISVL